MNEIKSCKKGYIEADGKCFKKTDLFPIEKIREKWSHEKPLIFKGRKYRVGKMSYGTYFLEPYEYKGGELEPFHGDTLWLEKIPRIDFLKIED